MTSDARRPVRWMVMVAVAACVTLLLGACGGDGGNGGGQAAAGSPSAGSRPAHNDNASLRVLRAPQSFRGRHVTVVGSVGKVLGPAAFTVTAGPRRQGHGMPGVRPLLVVEQRAAGVSAGSPVQVTGTVRPSLQVQRAQQQAAGSVSAGALSPYRDQPYVLAAFVGPPSANLVGAPCPSNGVGGVGSSGGSPGGGPGSGNNNVGSGSTHGGGAGPAGHNNNPDAGNGDMGAC